MATEVSESVTIDEVELTVDRWSDAGDVLDTVALDPAIFGVAPNVPLMHQVVTAQLAARRAGTQSTKTRAEVAGGAAKPYRQKGTGRARQGTIRAPHYAGGGVALGPKPRSYAQRTPRKMVRQALCCALSDRLTEGRLRLVDSWSFEVPKTKQAVAALEALELFGSVLVVLGPDDAVAERSFANLPNVDLVEGAQLTAYDVLANDWVVFTNETILGDIEVVEGSTRPAPEEELPPAEAESDADELATDELAADESPESTEVESDEADGTGAQAEDEASAGRADGEVSSPEGEDSSPEASAGEGASCDEDEDEEEDEEEAEDDQEEAE